MNIVCGLDFETTGLDPEKDRVIEIGAVLWDWERAIPVQMMSKIICLEGIEVDPKIAAVSHGLTTEDLNVWGVSNCSAWDELFSMMNMADFIMAHNGNAFDKKFFEAEWHRLKDVFGFEFNVDRIREKHWLDSRLDIPYPDHITNRKLVYLAADHGFLNPFAHRALFDVITMLNIAKRYPLDQIVKNSQAPTVRLTAHVSFEKKDEAKSRGFHWNPENKTWFRDVKDYDLEKATAELPFEFSKEILT